MTIPRYDDEARKLAHDTVDLLFDHIQQIEQRPVVDWHAPDELRELVRIDGSGGASGVELLRMVAEHSIQLHHPSYIGHQVCPPFPTAAIADLAISALNQSTAVWEMSPIATMIEKELIRWLADRADYPAESEGTVVSGGSLANLTGLMAARARWVNDASGRRPVIVCSADAHYSVARAASIMGIPAADVIKVATDEKHRMDVDALDETLAAIEASDELSTLAIVATCGSTATGAFDELHDIAGLRDRYRTWLHVDAAHGASLLLSDSMRHLAHGVAHADSFAWDPHKMLWMPLSLGVILVRNGEWLRRAFDADAPYLFDATQSRLNLGEMTIQCSKRADAIKLWLSLKLLGTAPFTEALERVADVTRYLHDRVRESDDFEAMHEPEFNIFCFRYRATNDESDERNARIRQRLIESGEAWITSTMLRGQRVLRATVINPRTGPEHIDALLASIRRIAGETA